MIIESLLFFKQKFMSLAFLLYIAEILLVYSKKFNIKNPLFKHFPMNSHQNTYSYQDNLSDINNKGR